MMSPKDQAIVISIYWNKVKSFLDLVLASTKRPSQHYEREECQTTKVWANYNKNIRTSEKIKPQRLFDNDE